MKNKFLKQVDFYLSAVVLVFTLVALLVYAINCPSEFNGGKVSSSVVTLDVIAIILSALCVCAYVLADIFGENKLISTILSYKRFAMYVALICILASFFMGILDEYSLLGTILYPIVSGTVGDPVDGNVSGGYFTAQILTFVALICAIVASAMDKVRFYRAQKAANGGV